MEKEFRFFDLGLVSRLLLSVGVFALGLALEIAFPRFIVLGIAVVIAGWFPLMLRLVTNKPEDQGLEDWRLVTLAEIDRLDDGISQSNKLKRRTMSVATGLVIGIGGPLAFIVMTWSFDYGRSDITFVVGNLVLLLVPALFFGRVRVFVPGDIAFKMPTIRAVLAEPLPAGITVAPYIRFDKDKKGGDVPEDLRLMLEQKRPPADLVGIQLQAAINKGPNGNVPYLYAVVLTKGKDGPAYASAKRMRVKGFEIEAGGDGDYGTVVIRQATSGTGYHTKPEDCRALAKVCIELLGGLAA
ncbi:MAG: hypothetical protein WCL50_01080 [Spirochaetota bacterium]